MDITLLKAKIHRAVVTQADLDYVGSITIDSDLLRESGILEYEKVDRHLYTAGIDRFYLSGKRS